MTNAPKPDTSVEAVERLACAVIVGSSFPDAGHLLRQLRKELTEARALLKWHHDWHLTSGPIGLQDGDGGWIEIDNAAEYCDSTMYERTAAVLADVPSEALPRGGVNSHWWAISVKQRREIKALQSQLTEAREKQRERELMLLRWLESDYCVVRVDMPDGSSHKPSKRELLNFFDIWLEQRGGIAEVKKDTPEGLFDALNASQKDQAR